MPSSRKFYVFRKLVKNAKWWSKANLPLEKVEGLHNFSLLKKDFLKQSTIVAIKCYWYCFDIVLIYIVLISTPHKHYVAAILTWRVVFILAVPLKRTVTDQRQLFWLHQELLSYNWYSVAAVIIMLPRIRRISPRGQLLLMLISCS